MRRHSKAVTAATAALLLTLALSATLASAVAPVVTIEDATNVSYTTADVKGTVSPEGQFTFWRFQYISEAQFQENLANSLPGFEGASTGIEEGTETEETLERQLASLKPGTTYHLRLQANNEDGEAEAVAANTFTTEAVGPPSVSIDPVTTFTGTTAKFTGTIDPEAPEEGPGEFPEAFNVSWHFECTPQCPGLEGGTVPADSASHAVQADTEGLEPNTTYEVTLVASNAGGQQSAGPESFKTDAVAPEVKAIYAGYLATDKATLGAEINPKNSQTTYQFEWGTDESYGNLAPATPQALGAQDNSFHVITAPLTGLAAGTTYHFRVVATNTETSQVSEGEDRSFTTLEPPAPPATPCPNAAVRSQQGASQLPDCRAYERVSPADKNGSDIELAQPARAAEDGDAIVFTSYGSFAGARSRLALNPYRAARGPAGWSTRSASPPADPFFTTGIPAIPEEASPDASHVVSSAYNSEVSGLPQQVNLWRYDASTDGFELLSQPTTPFPQEAAFLAFNRFAGASADFSHVVFSSRRRLTADSPPGNPASDKPPYLYEWFEGELRYVAVLPDGGVVADAVLGYLTPGEVRFHPGENPVSADGSRIFFTVGDSLSSPRQLYRREADPPGAAPPTTVRVDASERAVPDPAHRQVTLFQLANPQGSLAYFISPAKLTEDATASDTLLDSGGNSDACAFARCDLYRWDAGAGKRLTDLTTADPSGAAVIAAIGASEDTSSIYFVAYGDLAPGASQGEPNVYLWREGEGVRFIATLDGSVERTQPADASVWTNHLNPGVKAVFRDARVSPDGRWLAFRSRARLTAYDNTNPACRTPDQIAAGQNPQGRCFQVYLYDSEAGELLCASCNLRAASSSADAQLRQVKRDLFLRLPTFLSRNITPEGDLFFDSAEALLPGDSNGRLDVYRWSEGRLSLISSGEAADDAAFIDASVSGDDVFFTTGQQLSDGDEDGLRDLYDARVGGGFPLPVPPPPCEGDSCQPPPIVPEQATPASAGFSGRGNLNPAKPRKCAKGKRREKRRGKVRCLRKRGPRGTRGQR